jgi:tRNA-2-methylthio-N6-dimethylallyladenosine synthase
MDMQLPDDVKVARLHALQELLGEQQHRFNAATVGRKLPILLESEGRKPGQVVGRSPYMQAVHVEAAPELIGRLEDVHIVEAGANSLKGVINPLSDAARVSA